MTDNNWWPEGYNHPAFQVQRDVYSTALGGDYVRGSAQFKGTYSGAGTALPAGPADGDMWLVGTPVPTAAPTYTPPGGSPRAAAAGDVIRYQAGTEYSPSAKIASLVDAFTTQISTSVWTYGGGVTWDASQRAKIVVSDAYNSLSTLQATPYDLTSSSLFLQLALPTFAANSQAVIELRPPGGDANSRLYFRVYGSPTQIEAFKVSAGSYTQVATGTYSATNHAWLRIAEAGGTLTFSTSADGSTWTTFGTTADPAWSLTSVCLSITAANDNAISIGNAFIDSVNVVPGVPVGPTWVNWGPVTQAVGTALRYPTGSPATSAVSGKTILHVHTVDHSTVRIEWGWPPAPNDTWLEVSVVRSAFGRPSTVNDGVTVFRKVYAEFVNPLYPSADGRAKPLIDPPILDDTKLPPGRWYYYAIFFKMTPTEWVRGMVDSCLIPRDLQHAEHLWDNVPPYYRWVDGEQAYQEGRLRQFLNVFGFELDQTREYVESWQHLYDADRSPMRLLRKLGLNFGIEYESGLGDIRYRSLMSDIGHLYKTRGTPPSLELLVHNMSKYACKVTPGISLMLTPDDSDFFTNIGSWAGLHPQTAIGTTVATPDKVLLSKAPLGEVTQPQGRGALKVWTLSADATAALSVSTGCGIRYPNNNGDVTTQHEIFPHDYGIPTDDGVSYGFSVSVMVSVQPITVVPYLLFFDKKGLPYNPLLTVKGSPVGISDTVWHTYLIKGTAPAGATFVVPGLLFTDRPAAGPPVSPSIYLAGALVYVAGQEGEVLGVPPDRYLTMGDPSELLGKAKAGFDPFLLGTPS